MAGRFIPASVKTETAAEMFARMIKRSPAICLEPSLFPTVEPGTVIEITGDAGSGKSELLYHFIARFILPSIWKDIPLDGLDTGVIFVDNDYRFDILRLIRILELRIMSASKLQPISKFSQPELCDFIVERLAMLQVLRCSSLENFLITLHTVENLLGSNEKISCLMIDSISSFHRVGLMNYRKRLYVFYDQMVKHLERLLLYFRITIIATKPTLINRSKVSSDYEYMGPSWKKFGKYHVQLNFESCEKENTLLSLRLLCGKDVKDWRVCVTNAGAMIL